MLEWSDALVAAVLWRKAHSGVIAVQGAHDLLVANRCHPQQSGTFRALDLHRHCGDHGRHATLSTLTLRRGGWQAVPLYRARANEPDQDLAAHLFFDIGAQLHDAHYLSVSAHAARKPNKANSATPAANGDALRLSRRYPELLANLGMVLRLHLPRRSDIAYALNRALDALPSSAKGLNPQHFAYVMHCLTPIVARDGVGCRGCPSRAWFNVGHWAAATEVAEDDEVANAVKFVDQLATDRRLPRTFVIALRRRMKRGTEPADGLCDWIRQWIASHTAPFWEVDPVLRFKGERLETGEYDVLAALRLHANHNAISAIRLKEVSGRPSAPDIVKRLRAKRATRACIQRKTKYCWTDSNVPLPIARPNWSVAEASQLLSHP